MFFAAPHMAENTRSMTIEAYSAGLRPMMSVTRPLMGVMRVCERRYEVPTQEYWEGVAPSSAAIVGRAVEMIYYGQMRC
jgi:hypothetical protein